MSAGLKKIWRDLWASRAQATLAICALVLGIWGVGAILVANAILRADLRDNFTATRPAHASFVLADTLPPAALGNVRRVPGVQAAELRDSALLRIEVHDGEWIPLWLFGVTDFGATQVAQLRPQHGAAVPVPGSMLVERNGLKISELRVGVDANVRSGARNLKVMVSGIAFDPAQAPATQDHFIYGYTDSRTWSQLSGRPSGRRLLVRWGGVATKEQVQQRADELARMLVSQGVRITALDVPKFEAHPHQWQLDTLLLVQGAIGALAFGLGAILVSQLMASIMARQTRQIAIMKAIGATAPRLFLLYSIMVGAIAAVAAAIGIPLAVKSGIAFSQFVGQQLNFDIHPGVRPWWLDGALVAAAFLLPFVAAGPRVAHALSRPVREALDDHDMPRDPGWLPLLPRALPSVLRLALRNKLRQRRRAIVTVLTMALGVAIFDSGFNVRESLAVLLRETELSMSHDVQLVLDHSLPPAQAMAPFAGIPNVAFTESWNGGRGELQSRVFATANGIGIVALPADSTLMRPNMVQGRWLKSGLEVPEIVLNQQAAQLYGASQVGRDLNLQLETGQLRVRLVGVLRELDRPKLYIDRDTWDARFNPQHDVNSIMFVAKDRSYPAVLALKAKIEARVMASDLSVLYVMSQSERVKIVADHLDIVLTVLVLLSMLVLLVSAFGLASTTAIDVQERTRELGVMRAVGGTPGQVRMVLVLEGLLVGGTALVLGLLLTQPLSSAAATAFGQLMLGEQASLSRVTSLQGMGIVTVVTLLLVTVASFLPARTATAVPTREALAHV